MVIEGAIESLPALVEDTPDEVAKHLGAGLCARFETASYRSAAALLASTQRELLAEIEAALGEFSISKAMMTAPGGNESEIPKVLSSILRPRGWFETGLSADLVVHTRSRTPEGARATKHLLTGFVSGHKIDYVKGRVALDLEWNSKDQTFDRDLYAMRAFHECGIISVGVIVTRGTSLNAVIDALDLRHRYGASTTWMGKLRQRLESGRNGSCPVLALGITPSCLVDPPS